MPEWEINTDPEMAIKGFKIGDRVQWHGRGPAGRIGRFARMPKRSWYADLKMDDGSFNRWGLDFIKHAEIVEWLGHLAGDDVNG